MDTSKESHTNFKLGYRVYKGVEEEELKLEETDVDAGNGGA